MLLAAAAVRGGEQGPAVGRDLEGGLKRGRAGVWMPVGIRRIRLRGDSLKHGKPEGIEDLASASPTGGPELCSRMNRWFAGPGSHWMMGQKNHDAHDS